MRSHLEHGSHTTVCQIKEVFLIYFSNCRKQPVIINVETSNNSKLLKNPVYVHFLTTIKKLCFCAFYSAGALWKERGLGSGRLLPRFKVHRESWEWGGNHTNGQVPGTRDGTYEIKKNAKQVEKSLVFMHDVQVKWIGPGRYEIAKPNTVKKEHEDHWRLLRSCKKVHFVQKSVSLILTPPNLLQTDNMITCCKTCIRYDIIIRKKLHTIMHQYNPLFTHHRLEHSLKLNAMICYYSY